MRIHRGKSLEPDASRAVSDIVAQWDAPKPSLLLVFASTKQDLAQAGAALAELFPGVPTVGCSTTGEQLDGVHSTGSLVLAGIESKGIRWEATLVERLTDTAHIEATVSTLFQRLAIDRESFEPTHYVAFTLVDGLSMAEESYIATLADALEGIPVLGGSAGDDLAFQRTLVLGEGRTVSNAAVLVVAHAPHAYRIIKHQHFQRTQVALAVTRVDVAERRVYELDGMVAAEALARALGTTRERLRDEDTFLAPVLVSVSGDVYVRSIQRIEADGSIRFYCATEEGMVLQLASHEEMVPALAREVEAIAWPAEFLLTFNCILRAREADNCGVHEQLGHELCKLAPAAIGFDTYGEQLNGMHINQTLVALALREVA